MKTTKIKESEKVLEKKLTQVVKKMGGLALKFWGVSFTGFPDRIVLMPGGKFYTVELKSTGGRLSERQKLVIGQLKALEFDVSVIDNSEDLNKFLNRIAQ